MAVSVFFKPYESERAMAEPVVYFAHWCPDTEPFTAELKRLGVDYEPRDITQSGANLKAFLRLRDSHAAFEQVRADGRIGIPALVWRDGAVLDWQALADWHRADT
ncbi:hypothetical protein V6667_06770 [Neisseria leonii]|uniref:Glutaredoxin n=1 Tax=Neisseria leonii TaxID=2995413 RepID=A0A9X4E189_9NEIS|nr:hypothetical protein [Neisseria sp. 51.81]MDD9327636.1 hypothetical protein [Neisseria sp. 51.81]